MDTGINMPTDQYRQQIKKVFAGNTIELTFVARLNTGAVATDANSIIYFVLSDSPYSEPIFKENMWGKNITYTSLALGIIKVTIPSDISGALREGGYYYACTLEDKNTHTITTIAQGSLLVEYQPTSLHRNIPYH